MGVGKLVLRATLVGYLTGVMANAIRHVHAQHGLRVTDGGIEYPAVILTVPAALGDTGPGRFSLDEALGIRLRGPVYVAEHGEDLFGTNVADETLSRWAAEQVGADS